MRSLNVWRLGTYSENSKIRSKNTRICEVIDHILPELNNILQKIDCLEIKPYDELNKRWRINRIAIHHFGLTFQYRVLPQIL